MRPGQLTPENGTWRGESNAFDASFNEAGAINPGKPVGSWQFSTTDQGASMRPGQLTPENPPCIRRDRSSTSRFNEAGAINPGKPRTRFGSVRPRSSFNEAGAINPGKQEKRIADAQTAMPLQ